MFKKIIEKDKVVGITFRELKIETDQHNKLSIESDGSLVLCAHYDRLCSASCAALTVRGSNTRTFAVCIHNGVEMIIGALKVEEAIL